MMEQCDDIIKAETNEKTIQQPNHLLNHRPLVPIPIMADIKVLYNHTHSGGYNHAAFDYCRGVCG